MTEPIDQATKVMSNTDGENTQKVSLGELLLNAGTRIVDLEKQSNDQVEIITHLEKQLASLREQLAGAEQQIKSLNEIIENLMNDEKDDMINLREQLRQKDLESKYWLMQSKTLENDLFAEQQLVKVKQKEKEMMAIKLKQKEDENRELLDSISQLIYAMNTTGLPWNTDSTAEKAYANCRSLLKKYIG